MKKKLLCALLALLCLFAQAVAESSISAETPVITVDGKEITFDELKAEVRLELFIGALRCAGYGYAIDIADPLTIEDEMDKVMFAMEDRIATGWLIQEYGITLNEDDLLKAREAAAEEWRQYRDIAFSEDAKAFLPAGNFEPSDDPEENVKRYFASFGLTEDVLFSRACSDLLEEKLRVTYTAGLEGTDEELRMVYIDWTLDAFAEAEIIEDWEAIGNLQNTLWDE